jgi:hypothetical protein
MVNVARPAPVPTLAMIVWLATIFLMVWLTYETYRWGRRMLEQAVKAGINNSVANRSVAGKIIRDGPLWAIIIASAGILLAYGRQLNLFDGHLQTTNVRLITNER